MGVFSAVISFGIVNGDNIVELLNLIIRYFCQMVHCLRMEVPGMFNYKLQVKTS